MDGPAEPEPGLAAGPAIDSLVGLAEAVWRAAAVAHPHASRQPEQTVAACLNLLSPGAVAPVFRNRDDLLVLLAEVGRRLGREAADLRRELAATREEVRQLARQLADAAAHARQLDSRTIGLVRFGGPMATPIGYEANGGFGE